MFTEIQQNQIDIQKINYVLLSVSNYVNIMNETNFRHLFFTKIERPIFFCIFFLPVKRSVFYFLCNLVEFLFFLFPLPLYKRYV